MPNFESIRPYRDEEVPCVVRRLAANAALRDGLASFLFPRLYKSSAVATRLLVRVFLAWRVRSLTSVHDVQIMVGEFIDRMVEASVDHLSFSGLEALDSSKPYLFVSNHRDIALDSAFLNRVLHGEGFPTCQIAVGDNLFGSSHGHADDLMRLNRGFLVERSAVGAKATYAAMQRTSSYVRQSIAQGTSVWIAQRAGRAKDGFDRTEPALLKMLGLAFRKEFSRLDELLEAVQIVPVAISYELDPCDLLKAQELSLRAREANFEKPAGSDLASIVAGLRGYKGRVHLHFASPLAGRFESAEDIARAIDVAIVGGLKVYPTNVVARDLLRELLVTQPPASFGQLSWPAQQVTTETDHERSAAFFQQRLEDADETLRPFLLLQYANLLRNQSELGVLGPPRVTPATGKGTPAGASQSAETARQARHRELDDPR